MDTFKLPQEEKQIIIATLQEKLQQEWDLEVGNLAAELLLDDLAKQLYPYIYNQAIADCRQLLEQKMTSMEDDLYALERPAPLSKRG